MRSSSIALVLVAHLASGFVFGFVVAFFGFLIDPSAGLLLGSPALLGSAWIIGRWIFGREQRPQPLEVAIGAAAAAVLSLMSGGSLGLILSAVNSLAMLVGYRAAERKAARAQRPETA